MATPSFGIGARWRIVREIAWTIARTRIQGMGPLAYVLTWTMFPIFQILMVALIYRDNRALLDYAVIAGAGTSLIFIMLFNGGEILDTERGRGTLGNLFLSPSSRYVWLAGFQLFALVEAIVMGMVSVGFAVLVFDVDLAVNPPALLVTLGLLLFSLWGISMMLNAVGVLARGANLISNLMFPVAELLGGTMYPIAQMPDWVRIPARALPLGYAMQALVDAMTKNASIGDLRSELLPLAGFAVVLPVLGVLAFTRVERAVRKLGYLELS